MAGRACDHKKNSYNLILTSVSSIKANMTPLRIYGISSRAPAHSGPIMAATPATVRRIPCAVPAMPNIQIDRSIKSTEIGRKIRAHSPFQW